MKINKKNALKLWERYYGDARFAEDFHGYLMCRDGYGNPDFFIKEDGGRLYKNLVYNLVKRNLSKVATLKKRSPHVLRHTFATTMLNNDAELGAVKELLGHESIATTEIYAHATFEELKKVYKQAHPRA